MRQKLGALTESGLSTGRAFHYKEEAYALVFIRNGAHLSHFFRKMPLRQKWRKNSKFLTVRPVIRTSFDSAFGWKNSWICGIGIEQCLLLKVKYSINSVWGMNIMKILKSRYLFLTVHSEKSSKLTIICIVKLQKLKHYSFLVFATRTNTTEDKKSSDLRTVEISRTCTLF